MILVLDIIILILKIIKLVLDIIILILKIIIHWSSVKELFPSSLALF